MNILCVPGLSEDEVKSLQKKLSDAANYKVVVIPYNCNIVEISE